MTKKFLLLPFFSFLFLGISNAFAAEFENEHFILSENGGVFNEPLSVTLIPKDNQSVSWSFFRENPTNVHSTTEATRIFIPRNRNLYVIPENGQTKNFFFQIIKQVENKFFRIESVDANPFKNFLPTITVKNASPFSFSLNGWKIKGKNFKENLPNEEMEAGEKRTFIIDIKPNQKVEIISPNKRIRDQVQIPELKQSEIFIRKKAVSEKETRPEFVIREK